MKITDRYIFFWDDEPFTNFTECPELNFLGLNWKTSEQLFMWLKAVEFKDYKTATEIREAKTPKEAKKLGRQVKNFDAEHWSKVSYFWMRRIVEIKFRSNPEFLATLLDPAFDGKLFVEASPFDRIWGIGYRGGIAENHISTWGENKLGKILTELRERLKEEFTTVRTTLCQK